jgi:hypothetical protein
MLIGSALLLLHHVAHMLWLVHPSALSTVSWAGAAVLASVILWGIWFVMALRGRPTFASERGEAAPSA